ncbi:MAG: sulfurtransferase complex subunit TusB [Alphaproteobacteria bacterium]|nr:sulfurtransferase complex subunit TusB [Alphaproteobacteria bacterium]
MLHTVNKSPYERNTLESCLRLAKAGSAILLIEDGVYAAIAGSAAADQVAARTDDFTFHVLGPDIEARGLADKQLIDGVAVVDYTGFVELVAEYDAVQSWL